jgi:hypothetical protein
MDQDQLIASFIVTWTIVLIPPLMIRFVFLRRRISKKWAITVSIALWLFNTFIFVAAGSQSKSHAVLLLAAYITYKIIGPRKELSEAYKQKWNITDSQTPK